MPTRFTNYHQMTFQSDGEKMPPSTQVLNSIYDKVFEKIDGIYQSPIIALTTSWRNLVPEGIGWADPFELLVIENLDGKGLRQNPTPEELKELSKKSVQICISRQCFTGQTKSPDESNALLLSSGDSVVIRTVSSDPRYVYLRAAYKESFIRVQAVPKPKDKNNG